MRLNLTERATWAKEEWQSVNFGDKRLNTRAEKIAVEFLRNPFASPPKMLKSFKNLKAFYRFMDSDKVSHEKLINPHISKIKDRLASQKIILAVQDATTITLNRNYDIEGLYGIGGENDSQGIIVQNTISVIPHANYGVIDGLLHQTVLNRKPKEERTPEDKETRLWTDSINAVGKPFEGNTIIDVMDRGADAAEIMNCSISVGHEFIVRAKSNRYVRDEQSSRLFEFGEALPVVGGIALEVRSKDKKGKNRKREANLNISFGEVTLPPPKTLTHLPPLKCSLVRVFEVSVPEGQEPIEWFLLTSLEVSSFEDALKIARYYSYRWIIEEYHKCLKTGFRIEKTQMRALDRIKALLGFISVSSVRLLQLRDVVKRDPNAAATEYVQSEDVWLVQAYYKLPFGKLSIGQFLKYIAQMGGFLNRKSDGNPGWQSLWEGWKFFMGLKEGVELYKEKLMGNE